MTHSFLISLAQFIESSKYVLLFLLCIVEGPVTMISSGFLFRLGTFNFLPMYLSLMGGDFVADIGWYMVGRYGARTFVHRYGKHFHITPAILSKIETRFKKYQEKILFISKITMGFGFALVTLIVAGILKVPLRRYALLNLLGGFIWTGLLVVVGYFFGGVYTTLSSAARVIFVVIALAGVVAALNGGAAYLRKIESL